MGVGNIAPVNRRSIAIYWFFSDCIGDLLAALGLRKVPERVLPPVCSSHRLTLDFYTISQKIHCDSRGTLSVLVITVIPFFLAGH